jgi:hypothetical protein
MVCLHAIRTAQDLGITEVEFESDAPILVQPINNSEFDRADNGVLFREIKTLLSASFNLVVVVKFSPRACNMVANALGSHGSKLLLSPHVTWTGDAPSFVRSVVTSDRAGLSR